MVTFVPKNSRRKIQRTRRAGKISLGMMNSEAVCDCLLWGVSVCGPKCFNSTSRYAQLQKNLAI